MQDIKFDIITQDAPLTDSGDFILTQNPSVQNGGIILYSQCSIIRKPEVGIGFGEEIMGGPAIVATAQMNRWKSQVAQDGGKANWNPAPGNTLEGFDFVANTDYTG